MTAHDSDDDFRDENLRSICTHDISDICELNFSSATTLINNLTHYMRLKAAVEMGDVNQLKSYLPGMLLSLHERLVTCSRHSSLDEHSQQPDIVRDASDATTWTNKVWCCW